MDEMENKMKKSNEEMKNFNEKIQKSMNTMEKLLLKRFPKRYI